MLFVGSRILRTSYRYPPAGDRCCRVVAPNLTPCSPGTSLWPYHIGRVPTKQSTKHPWIPAKQYNRKSPKLPQWLAPSNISRWHTHIAPMLTAHRMTYTSHSRHVHNIHAFHTLAERSMPPCGTWHAAAWLPAYLLKPLPVTAHPRQFFCGPFAASNATFSLQCRAASMHAPVSICALVGLESAESTALECDRLGALHQPGESHVRTEKAKPVRPPTPYDPTLPHPTRLYPGVGSQAATAAAAATAAEPRCNGTHPVEFAHLESPT
jgi:hypothetical protein